jgi:hypothetical protein
MTQSSHDESNTPSTNTFVALSLTEDERAISLILEECRLSLGSDLASSPGLCSLRPLPRSRFLNSIAPLPCHGRSLPECQGEGEGSPCAQAMRSSSLRESR